MQENSVLDSHSISDNLYNGRITADLSHHSLRTFSRSISGPALCFDGNLKSAIDVAFVPAGGILAGMALTAGGSNADVVGIGEGALEFRVPSISGGDSS